MFVFNGNGLLVSTSEPITVAAQTRDDYRSFKGISVISTNETAPAGYEYRDLRWLSGVLDNETISKAELGFQMWRWDETSQFCGRCGTANTYDSLENCKLCPSCSHRQYPAQFPVAIVAVTRGDQLLLAHNANFPEGLFSVLAGYVEIGENLEGTVHREVQEEVGIKIGKLRYFGSQNWAASSALMLGFQAEWEAGEIQVDGVEIAEAAWFSRNQLPQALPRPGSIGRRLIDAFRNAE